MCLLWLYHFCLVVPGQVNIVSTEYGHVTKKYEMSLLFLRRLSNSITLILNILSLKEKEIITECRQEEQTEPN